MKIPLNKQDQKTYCTCMILGLIVACIVFYSQKDAIFVEMKCKIFRIKF